MKKIPIPVVNDNAILKSIASQALLAACPHIKNDHAMVRLRYRKYVAAGGNPIAANAPLPITLRGALQGVLKQKYASSSREFAYIKDIRDNSSPNICVMCGSPTSGTVDHVFPQTPFSDFAIFSKNLVPTCSKCNSNRQNNYIGRNPGERVLHPYFDTVLNQRLLRAKISPYAGSYRRPDITLSVCINRTNPLYPAVYYHMENVVLVAGVLQSLRDLWVNLQRKNDVYFQMLPRGNFSSSIFNGEVKRVLGLYDKEFSTPNNWRSMLLAGLSINSHAKAYLAQTIRDIRSRVLNPRDI